MAAPLFKEALFCAEYHSVTKTCQASHSGEILRACQTRKTAEANGAGCLWADMPAMRRTT
jgi:hypothetical protein